jgi:hypothetical protein
MHTAKQLRRDLYRYMLNGVPAQREDVIEDFGPSARFAIVIDRPYGDVGASLLVQSFITCAYDARPQRRDADPQYPEVYVFHYGGRFGNHSAFDFYPPRKEVFIEADAPALLETLDNYAITHLALPEKEAAEKVTPRFWADEQSYRERTRWTALYSHAGRVRHPSIAITGTDLVVETNTRNALSQHTRLASLKQRSIGELAAILPGATTIAEAKRWMTAFEQRLLEVPEEQCEEILRSRTELFDADGLPSETYHQLEPTEALLYFGPA